MTHKMTTQYCAFRLPRASSS